MFSKKPWPNDRGLTAICTLHAYNTPETLRSNQPNIVDIIRDINDGDTVVDFGMGNGQFLIDLYLALHQADKKAELIGISASTDEIKSRACHYANIQIIKGKFPCYSAQFQDLQDNPSAGIIAYPEDNAVQKFLYEKQGQVAYIFDTFGPSTYSYNPLHQLIYAAILLKEGGCFSAITSTNGKNTFSSVFGSLESRDKIVDFFQNNLGITLHFQDTTIQSRVEPGKINTDLLVSFTKGNLNIEADDYDNLIRQADFVIGLPKKVKVSWYKYRGFEITMRSYKTLQPYASSPETGEKEDKGLKL